MCPKSENKWLDNFDLKAFAKDIEELGSVLEAKQGRDDVEHLKKIVMWSNVCAFVGICTMGLDMGIGLRILSVCALSTWTFSRWTMIAHHTCHGGYDKIHPNKHRWNRFK